MATTLADRSPLPRRLTTRRKKRRGLVLLMVVSLLALFLLMGVTFAILAIQYKTAASVQARHGEYGDPPMQEMEQALGAVLYDSNGRGSLQGHSLLRDLYGTDYVTTTVANTTVNEAPRKSVNSHFLVFSINTNATMSTAPGYYNGRVITFITGQAAGISSRIAGYEPFDPNPGAGGPTELYIEPLVGMSGNPVIPANGDQFVINGAPFNGMGFGYDPANYLLDAIDNTTDRRQVTLLPHYAGYADRQVYSTNGTSIAPDVGGADEPYDAAGLQDLALSVTPASLIASSTGNNRYSVPLIPSYMRPELVNYWLNNWPGSIDLTQPGQKDFARKFIFRPMPWDHPNFTGSNPDLTPAGNTSAAYETLIRLMAQQGALNGTPSWHAMWDVDNDGDGVRDSIWIDVGMPVVTSPSGRRYKRLFAILIKDLDGRVNLNVHGNLGQITATGQPNVLARTNINYPFPAFGLNALPATVSFPHNATGAVGATRQVQLPRGMGFGPAEVNFGGLLDIAGLGTQYGTILRARYGGDNVPGTNGDDPLSVVKMAGVPANYLADSWYASPPDVWGRNAVAVDFGGRPFFFRESIMASGETIDDPYEMEWDPKTALHDTPYTPGHMEHLARTHDHDVQNFPLPQPTLLSDLFQGIGQPNFGGGSFHRLRESLTTMSSSLPIVPAIARPQNRPALGSSNVSAPAGVTVIDLYKTMYLAGGGGAIVGNPSQLRAELAKIMPWEFWQGKPLDLNRYLSNGADDNGNGANGEMLEAFAGETAFGTDGSVPSGGNLPPGFSGAINGRGGFPVNSIDANGDNYQDGISGSTTQQGMDRINARQLLARHLYCLMMALNGRGYDPPTATQLGTSATTARMFAQWAINIVDFRDTDGIITGFEYDINPWDGWSVDGNLTTFDPNSGIVWGCEAPELLLTEGFALHDRRVKDTANDSATRKKRTENPNPDTTLDQFRIPQGSLFFEMYCPRTHTVYNPAAGAGEALYNPQMPFELYDRTTGKLALDRATPRGEPVWQVAIAKLRNSRDATGFPQSQILPANWQAAYYADPSNPPVPDRLLYESTSGATIELERYVWFINNDGVGWSNPKRDRVFYNANGYTARLSPGQYMVVGPRETTYLGSNKTDINDPEASGYWQGPSRQRITLSKTTGVEIVDAANNTTSRVSLPAATADIQPVAAMAVMTRPPDLWSAVKLNDYKYWPGLNVTEPMPQSTSPAYYPEYDSANTMWSPFDAYDDPETPTNILQKPMDNNRVLGQAGMLESRIHPDRTAIFLQRLADPTRNWHPQENPYITVDSASIDVTVFTGEEDTTDVVMAGMPPMPQSLDPDDRSPAAGGGARPNKYSTLQRGVTNGNVWLPIFTDTTLMAPNPLPQPSNDRYFDKSIHHTLGYLNEALGSVRPFGPDTGNSRSYVGDPSDTDKPFPWITWNNRPYMNAAELLLVPTSAPNRLVLEISPDNPVVPTPATANPYTAAPTDGRQLRQPFAHLMNMFQSRPDQASVPANSMSLCRLMDYVEVPSNFVGAERWYGPGAMAATDSPTPTFPQLRPEYVPPYLFRPPFNKLSRFRDPGKININTIYDFVRDPGTGQVNSPTWNAIVGYDAFSNNPLNNNVRTTTVDEIFQSRQGYDSPVGQMNNAYPTIFANPFRPADTADLMPNAANMRNYSPVEVSLLRPSRVRTREPLFMNHATGNPNDTDRHAYFRYQGLQKLPNILTTQSNCYAIWITAGYFEVEDSATGVDAGHPDGFQLGQELGMDTGNAQRHRSFFLIDRSIPAGFIPGMKLNTDNCILLKRQID